MQIRRMSEAGEHSARLVEAAPLDVEDLADAGLGSGKDGIGDVKRYDRDAAVFEDVEHLLGLFANVGGIHTGSWGIRNDPGKFAAMLATGRSEEQTSELQ